MTAGGGRARGRRRPWRQPQRASRSFVWERQMSAKHWKGSTAGTVGSIWDPCKTRVPAVQHVRPRLANPRRIRRRRRCGCASDSPTLGWEDTEIGTPPSALSSQPAAASFTQMVLPMPHAASSAWCSTPHFRFHHAPPLCSVLGVPLPPTHRLQRCDTCFEVVFQRKRPTTDPSCRWATKPLWVLSPTL